MNNIKDRAMLVSLSISVWTARAHDKRVSKEVAQKHNAPADVGKYHKKLLAEAPSYDAVTKLEGEIRKWHYTQTLPWSQDGSRILPAQNYFDYTGALREHRARFDSSVAAFIHHYPGLKQTAKIRLNGLYREEDYPGEHEIRDHFEIETKIFPMPAAEDFRINLGDEEVAMIRERISLDVAAAQQIAMRDLWNRLHSGVSHLVERLSDPDKVFRDTLVTNLRELCSLLPRLNLTQDRQLEAMRAEIETRLSGQNPQSLREDPSLRAKVAQEAARIQSVMSAYMGAPSDASNAA